MSKSIIPETKIRSIFNVVSKKEGVTRISKKAVQATIDAMELIGAEISDDIVRLSKHAGRDTVKSDDVKLAVK